MSTEPILRIEALGKGFATSRGRVEVLHGIDLTAAAGEFLSILGPSGAGKSTLLRLVAGLEAPDTGRIVLAGTTVADAARRLNLPPDRRGLGMVFQSGGVWPHMSVRDNVSFPLVARARALGLRHAEIAAKTDEALRLVSMAALAGRRAGELSGGEKQRVALARAVVAAPRIVLLDEPLASLDANLREQMRGLLRDLQDQLGLTFVQVSHDQVDALSMSHRVAVMAAGRIVQVGRPEDIYRRPASAFVATFVGEGSVVELEGRRLLLRPEDIGFAAAAPTAGEPGWIAGQVISAAYLGARRRLVVGCTLGALTVDVPAGAEVAAGQACALRIAPGMGIALK